MKHKNEDIKKLNMAKNLQRMAEYFRRYGANPESLKVKFPDSSVVDEILEGANETKE